MTSVTPPAKLDLDQVVRGAFALPWRRRAAFARALAVPALAIVVMQVGWGLTDARAQDVVGWAAYAGYGILWILFAVACHRVVLLDLRDDQIPAIPGWGRRETIFLAWLAAITVVILAAVWVALLILGNVAMWVVSRDAVAMLVEYSQAFIGLYLFARFAFLLPATAIDAPSSLRTAWRQTRGNGWRMVVVVGVLPAAFRWIAYLIEGDDPGMALGLVMTAAATVLLAVEICALSLAYRELATGADAPAPAAPGAA